MILKLCILLEIGKRWWNSNEEKYVIYGGNIEKDHKLEYANDILNIHVEVKQIFFWERYPKLTGVNNDSGKLFICMQHFQQESFSNIQKDLSRLLETGVESDFTISMEDGETFNVHRCILAG
jgi:uncharacterized linocin/CFP29 family protein